MRHCVSYCTMFVTGYAVRDVVVQHKEITNYGSIEKCWVPGKEHKLYDRVLLFILFYCKEAIFSCNVQYSSWEICRWHDRRVWVAGLVWVIY
jgi:hypothetical protein